MRTDQAAIRNKLMSYKVTFKEFPDYIDATITGTNSRDVVSQYMDEIRAECSRKDCFRVLINEQLEGPRLDAMEVFSLVSDGSMKALGQFDAIAYVDEQMGDMAEFAETVAVNRGMPIAMFASVDDAKAWLSRHNSGSGGQDIFRARRPGEDG
jgi:hypothetical protein